MTIRRWLENPSSDEELPELYQTAIRNAVLKLVIEGRVADDSNVVAEVMKNPDLLAQSAAIKALGFPDGLSQDFDSQRDQISAGLLHIGSLESRRERVDKQKKKILGFKKMGKEWKERISVLSRVISSRNTPIIEKFTAYGALFYLIMTFDLIPDPVPVFGLLDDFAILGIAAAYYLKRSSLTPTK
jgi:uncharacterized membrane protein YkvA (DUF1232 family)